MLPVAGSSYFDHLKGWYAHMDEFGIFFISQDKNKVRTVLMLLSKVNSNKHSKNNEYLKKKNFSEMLSGKVQH